MDNVDKIDFAMKVVATGCCICALALAAKTYKDLKSFEADDMVIDEQTQSDSKQIDNDTDIYKESDQTIYIS